ncbi:hypothetical protein TRAPUB_2680 [Trametes pubescens]|uniref:Uncharacterized protein n=1 Tax=Trametes pubescens TaxID=154538 RepID=A0A1M2VFY6_TRAPU|nr:hypothetical protein TRAPUB_2680 [Trametes pubescens]
MSCNTVAGPSNAIFAASSVPGDVRSEETLVAVDSGRAHSQDEEAQLLELEEQFLNFDECAEENVPPSTHNSCCAQHTDGQANTSSANGVPLLDTQTAVVPGSYASLPLNASQMTEAPYSSLPPTPFVPYIPQELGPSYFWAALSHEHAASSASTSTSMTTSSTGGQKRGRVDDQEDAEDEAPASKRTRGSEEHLEEEGNLRAEVPEAEEVASADDESVQTEELQDEEAAAVEAGEVQGAEDQEPVPRAKRPRRTNTTMLKTTCRLPKSRCPVENCARGTFDSYDHDANKAHLAAHLGATAVIPCLWPDCEETRSSPRLMFKHITEGHIGLPYVCPLFRRGCKWVSTKSQWQAQHVRRGCLFRPGAPPAPVIVP